MTNEEYEEILLKQELQSQASLLLTAINDDVDIKVIHSLVKGIEEFVNKKCDYPKTLGTRIQG